MTTMKNAQNILNIDEIAKSSNNFPEPCDNQILVTAGMGFSYEKSEKQLPRDIFVGILPVIGEVIFFELFSSEKVIEVATKYQLPDHLFLDYLPENRMYQQIKRKSDGRTLFDILYSRDYHRINISYIHLFRELDWFPYEYPSEKPLETLQLEFRRRFLIFIAG